MAAASPRVPAAPQPPGDSQDRIRQLRAQGPAAAGRQQEVGFDSGARELQQKIVKLQQEVAKQKQEVAKLKQKINRLQLLQQPAKNSTDNFNTNKMAQTHKHMQIMDNLCEVQSISPDTERSVLQNTHNIYMNTEQLQRHADQLNKLSAKIDELNKNQLIKQALNSQLSLADMTKVSALYLSSFKDLNCVREKNDDWQVQRKGRNPLRGRVISSEKWVNLKNMLKKRHDKFNNLYVAKHELKKLINRLPKDIASRVSLRESENRLRFANILKELRE